MTILLTAANGRTGRAVLTALKEAGASVKVFIRDEGQWPALQTLGASAYAVGDMEDAASIEAAIEGCEKLVHIGPPMHPHEIEITDRLIDAGLKTGLQQFIYYSVMHPLRRAVRHHRLKLDAEEHVIESGLPYTIVQPTRYMQHLAPIWSSVKDKGEHAMAFSTEVKFNVADLRDLADATAVVATQPGHLYATYELAGPEPLSQTDMAEIISEVLGRDVTARAIPLDELKQKARAAGASDDRVEQMLTMNDHYDRFGFRGNPNVLRWLLGRELRRFQDYVKDLAQQ